MSSAEQLPKQLDEEVHREAESRIVKFRYKKPENWGPRPKVSVRLCDSGLLRGHIQVLKAKGGENNLHYHSKVDGMFTVISGRIKFYGPGDELIGEFGRLEGVLIPKDARYWFENVSDDDAEVMLVQGFHEKGAVASGRTDSSPRKIADAGENDATNSPKRTAVVK
jgi:mannose-6-phosphate isomerase-like protein (cupin superfamily)